MNKIHSKVCSKAKCRRLAALLVGLVFAAPVSAQWPTLDWVIEDRADAIDQLTSSTPSDERQRIAQKHKEMLYAASQWYESMGFPPPLQINQDNHLPAKKGDQYLAFLKKDTADFISSHDSGGEMQLSSSPFFLAPKTKADRLLEASAVHELFHALQRSNPTSSYFKYAHTQPVPPGPPKCRKASITGDDWITEGSAAYAQIRWLEYSNGYRYGHPFKGSPRGNWVRYYDQPLHWPSLPQSLRDTSRDQSLIKQYRTEGLSYLCSYGTWDFWYAMGEMLGSTRPDDPRRLTYLRYIFDQPGPWQVTGLAQVDAGLKQAGEAYNVIAPYRGGLFNLYPLFVARYLDNGGFYEKLEEVTLASRAFYETTAEKSGGALQPIAARAWRFRIQVPEDTPSSVPYRIRVVLEPSSDREPMHLIVGRKVISPPSDPTALYSYTTTSSNEPRNENGEIELLVRVANVARDAADTPAADFALRVEVEGFYGDPPDTTQVNDQLAVMLPPGFDVQGPGAIWNCTGGATARASFVLMTPDGVGTELERMLPQAKKNLESDFDQAQIMAKELVEMQAKELAKIKARGLAGATDMRQDNNVIINADTLNKMEALRALVEDKMAAAMAGQTGAIIDTAADKARAQSETTLSAQFNGRHGSQDCLLMLTATLPGRSGGAQTVTGDNFKVGVVPEWATSMAGAQAMAGDDSTKWGVCNDAPCMTPKLVLEQAEHNHLVGWFQLQVVRHDVHGVPTEYGNVSGHFNSTSTHTENDTGLLDFMNRFTDTVTGDIQWTGPALPGGSTFMPPH